MAETEAQRIKDWWEVQCKQFTMKVNFNCAARFTLDKTVGDEFKQRL